MCMHMHAHMHTCREARGEKRTGQRTRVAI
jgi:hypothetical protein